MLVIRVKISTKGRYALRLMLDLALTNSDGYVKIKDIAKRQNISEKYLEQIVNILSKSGFVKSIRGASGGYKLTKDPKDYTVGMIIRLTEGSLAPVSCVEFEDNDCDRYNTCATVEVWKRLNDAISSVVDSITLEELVKISREKNQIIIN